MDGDHFQPNGFGLLPTVALAAATAGTMQSIVDNISNLAAETRTEHEWYRVNEAMRDLVAHNAELAYRVDDMGKAYDLIFSQYQVLADLAVQQAGQLQALRERGVVIDGARLQNLISLHQIFESSETSTSPAPSALRSVRR
jgi:hypothetical protein